MTSYTNKDTPDETVIEILKKVKSGAHPDELAKDYGVSSTIIKAWAKRVGLTWKKIYGRNWDAIKARVMNGK